MTAFETHEWIYEALKLPERDVCMVQIEGSKRQVFIKLVDHTAGLTLLQATNGSATCKHTNGEITQVAITEAGVGTRKILIANLPPEVSESAVKSALCNYGSVLSVREEQWARPYKYAVPNGIRQVLMTLNKHIPSNVTVDGYCLLLSYEGQPITCLGCGEAGHLYSTCTKRRSIRPELRLQQPTTYAAIVASSKLPIPDMSKQVSQPVFELEQTPDSQIHVNIPDTMVTSMECPQPQASHSLDDFPALHITKDHNKHERASEHHKSSMPMVIDVEHEGEGMVPSGTETTDREGSSTKGLPGPPRKTHNILLPPPLCERVKGGKLYVT
jgi:hypothetical protein